jgi:4-hydroxy-tetrahydrodipicolinate synthase
MRFQGILTAIVTPFDADGGLDEDAFGALARHLLARGSDGLVVTGTTGEGATITDEEDVVLWRLAVEIGREAGRNVQIVAGTGSNDTRHTIEQTQRAAECGVDGALVVAPYYNRPDRRGLAAHFTAVADASELPIIAYNIPSRSAVDMPNDLLAELGQHERIVAVKQARTDETLAPIDGLDLLAGNDDALGRVLELGGTGGILVASHLVGTEMRRMIDEPGKRAEIEQSLLPLYDALGVAPAAVSVKAALRILGLPSGTVRLPYVDLTEDQESALRTALATHGLLQEVSP